MKKKLICLTFLLCLTSVIGIAQAQSITLNGFEGNYSKPIVADGIVYVATPTRLYTLNATDGFKLWSTGVGANNTILSVPVISNNVCYIASSNNRLFAINVTTGMATKITPYTADTTIIDGVNIDTQTKISNTSTEIDGTTYTVLNDATVHASGNINWIVSIDGERYGMPVGSTIYEKQAQATATVQPTVTPTASPTPTATPTATPTPTVEAENVEAHENAVYGNFNAAQETQNNIITVASILVVAVIALASVLTIRKKMKK